MKNIYHFIVDRKIPTLASSIAFFLVLNGGSFLFLFIIISSVFSNNFNDLLINNIADGKLKDLVVYFFNYQNNIPYSIILICTSIYSASSLYYHFFSVVELISFTHYEISISKRLLAIISTLIFLLILNFITLLLSELFYFFNGKYQLLALILFIFIFCIIIYLLDALALKDYHLKRNYKGFIFTILYFIFFTFGFVIYLKLFSDFKIVYGILSFFIILLFYLYSLCIGLLIGININIKNFSIIKSIFSQKI